MEDKKHYNHAFDLGFSVMSTDPNGEATNEEILNALRRRVAALTANPDEIQDAVSCYDVSDEPYDNESHLKWQKEFDGGNLLTVIEVVGGIPASAVTLHEEAANELFSKMAQENGAGESEIEDLLNQHGFYSNDNYTVGIVKSNVKNH
jgi:hypothetical protein